MSEHWNAKLLREQAEAEKFITKDSGKKAVYEHEGYDRVSEFNYVTKDSGKKVVYEDGMQRDTSEGKPRFDLLLPRGVPFEEQLITRVADLYARGAVKYGDRNWEKSNTEESLAHHEAALLRHMYKYLTGVEDGEDHAAAIVWNVNAVDLTRRKIAKKLNKSPIEVQPQYEDEKKPVDFTPENLSFAVGDTILDWNKDPWTYQGDSWRRPQGRLPEYRAKFDTLVKGFSPLTVISGSFNGLTIYKDGNLSWN